MKINGSRGFYLNCELVKLGDMCQCFGDLISGGA
jgi:hypothetical protein